MVIKEAIKRSNAKIGTRDTDLLFRSVLKKNSLELMLSKNDELSIKDEKKIQNAISRLIFGEPLQYILGNTEFMSLEFDVSPAVLIPRSDTETLVEEVIKKAPNAPKILDIGTGSGCIAVSLAHYIKNSNVFALDISHDALCLASENAKKNNVKITFINHDIKKDFTDDFFKKIGGKFDIIVSNPPYIETDVIKTLEKNVKDHEPYCALDGGKDGLDFYRRIIKVAPQILSSGGQIFFEVGHTQADAVLALMADDFFETGIEKDLCNISRVVFGRLSDKFLIDK